MGLEERIPYPVDPNTDMEDPFQAGLQRFATQSPIGCRYLETSATWKTVNNNNTTTLPFLSTAGAVQFDPYKMIDYSVSGGIIIPQPGVWDISFQVLVDSTPVVAGDLFIAQFGQGTFTASLFNEMADARWAAANGQAQILRVSDLVWIPRVTLKAGSTYLLRAYQVNGGATSRNIKIISFSAWLRSANAPSKY